MKKLVLIVMIGALFPAIQTSYAGEEEKDLFFDLIRGGARAGYEDYRDRREHGQYKDRADQRYQRRTMYAWTKAEIYVWKYGEISKIRNENLRTRAWLFLKTRQVKFDQDIAFQRQVSGGQWPAADFSAEVREIQRISGVDQATAAKMVAEFRNTRAKEVGQQKGSSGGVFGNPQEVILGGKPNISSRQVENPNNYIRGPKPAKVVVRPLKPDAVQLRLQEIEEALLQIRERLRQKQEEFIRFGEILQQKNLSKDDEGDVLLSRAILAERIAILKKEQQLLEKERQLLK